MEYHEARNNMMPRTKPTHANIVIIPAVNVDPDITSGVQSL